MHDLSRMQAARLNHLRDAVCDYLDEELFEEFITDLETVLKEESNSYVKKAAVYMMALNRIKNNIAGD